MSTPTQAAASDVWIADELLVVHSAAARGLDNATIGAAIGRPSADVDLALWAMMGRTPVRQALAELNAARVGGRVRA